MAVTPMWGHTAKTPKVGPAHWGVVGFSAIFLVHMSLPTFEIAAGGILFFVILAWFKVPLGAFLSWANYKIAGGAMDAGQRQRNYFRRTRF